MAITIDGTTGSTQPSVAMTGSTSGTVVFTPPAIAGTQGYILPSALPTANGQALVATTAGIMSWSTPVGGNAVPSGSNTQVQFNSAGAFAGSSNFVWDNTNARLGIATSSPTARLHISGGGNDLIQFGTKVFAACASKTIYVTTSGNDTTGTGAVGAPYLTVSRAIQDIPYYLTSDVTINIGAGTFTIASILYLRGRFGGGEGEGRIYITGAGSGSTTLAMGDTGGFYLYDVDVPLYFQSMNITCGTAYAIIAYRCRWISIANSVTMSLAPVSGGWNGRINIYDTVYFESQAVITLTSGSLAGLGGVIVLYGVTEAYLAGSITKTGTRFANTGVSVCNNTTLMLQMTIDNFLQGLALGVNHYGAEGPGMVIANSATIRNCQYGVLIYAGSTYINYFTTFTSNTQNVYNRDGNYAGQWNMVDRLGIGLDGALSTYKIQVNGQPAANGYTAWTNYSDARLKENVENFTTDSVLDKFAQLRPVSFNYNELTGFNEDSRKRKVSGFIAQELQTIFPDMVGTTTIKDNEYLDTNLSNLNLYLVKAIQELKALTDAQAIKIAQLEAK